MCHLHEVQRQAPFYAKLIIQHLNYMYICQCPNYCFLGVHSDRHTQSCKELFRKLYHSSYRVLSNHSGSITNVNGSAIREQLKCKFDVAYMMAKQNLPFTKKKAVCQLHAEEGMVPTWGQATRTIVAVSSSCLLLVTLFNKMSLANCK